MPPPDESLMRDAIGLAGEAASIGEVPIGCVVFDDAAGEVIGRGYNRREADRDPTAHAEVLALRAAAARRGHWRLTGCTLVVTLEPCPMCAGAIVNARVGRVVYGCDDPKAGAARTLYRVCDDPRLNHRAAVQGGVLADECAALLRDFFKAQRALGKK
jgi:tRNA(adenine34) deaminase